MLTSRQEAFVRGLARGLSQKEAYQKAGYQTEGIVSEAAASRLLRNVKVKSRLSELQAEAAEATKISIKSLTEDLIRLLGLAEANKQAAAGVAAVGMIAKLHGLLVDRSELDATVHKPAPGPEPVRDVLLDEEDWVARFGRKPS
jgi:phage terminase small subunit